MTSKLDQLRAMSTVVADTGDLGPVARLKSVDYTTSPTIVLKCVDTPEYRNAVDPAFAWGRGQSGDARRVAAAGNRSYVGRRLFIGEAYDRTIHQIPRRLHRPPRRTHQ